MKQITLSLVVLVLGFESQTKLNCSVKNNPIANYILFITSWCKLQLVLISIVE